MVIEFGAFQDCLSLKELHFEKCTQPVNTDIYRCNVPDDMKIIVHDKMYQKFFDIEIPANKYRLQLYSEYIQKKIDYIMHSHIITSIIYLDGIVNMLDASCQQIVEMLKTIRQYLKSKYAVSDATISYVQYLMQKKQEIQDES